MAVYMTNLPFNHYENTYVQEHELALYPAYKGPNRKQMSRPLLDEAYTTVKRKVDAQLDICNYLNFCTDKTTNIRKERVINLCYHIPPTATFNEGRFHLKAETEVARTITAKIQAA